MLGTMNQNTSSGLKILYLALSGVGMGSCLQSMLVVAQASVPKNLVFITTTIVQFMRVIGGAFGIAIVATVFNTVLSKRLAETALTYPEYAELIKSVSDNSSLAWAPDVPPELHNLIISNFTKAINSVFYTTVPFLVVAFIFTLGIKHINLGGKK
ncbi:putative MFS-type transporter YusP [Zancudomyces culisetae]|uniref:Putative MFS-type transporter YusP n=1 Tax=Zancudomyces culisetae TaxID=1213189 RepID=A0A1R1PS05_ZANCU|nr:putative MFS-type transporter YusP [Zancudomyces culisetae]|eukprot:OMH83766.1 putative MFS-type transporter YusP [Zancudomyces culisetae]